MNSRKPRRLTIGTILLVLAASIGIVSAALLGGFIPRSRYGVHTQPPSVTYSGYFSINYVGVYHHVNAVPVCRTAFPPCLTKDEPLFFMNAKNGTIRLMFYCGVIPYYCESPTQLSFSDGTCLHVKGTLIEPSKWPTNQFSPSMHFNGDLYVFENQTLPKASCS
jgi:hypothetical protein